MLKEDYNEELKDKYVQIAKSKIVDKFHVNESTSTKFRNLKQIFFESFKDIFQENQVEYCPSYATRIFMEEHDRADLYYDSKEFIKRANKKYKVCLVSDADTEMIENQVKNFDFDKIFISENIQSYKGEPNYKIFKEVINHYNIEPYKIIHIGDSSSDMLGANRAGIDTCWINRHNYKKKFDIKPEYETESLEELFSILNI
ncbi:HAD family hydrolase [Tissierella sp. MB52-C2]|uniref:HAD family hydrolase n=1 Tax=Tissierella sp. MB52-C2 TaxID=3070999 RepID=UPI00280A80E5|nr:HAD family hydrolase [Tissierella sp. MB52-C2]WMM26994.1 HAD family hydrolase [Tissierella sp. MB52-C2]